LVHKKVSKLSVIVVAELLQARRPSCHPTNSIKALMDENKLAIMACFSLFFSFSSIGQVYIYPSAEALILDFLAVGHEVRLVDFKRPLGWPS